MSRTATARSEHPPFPPHTHAGLLPSPMSRPPTQLALRSPLKFKETTAASTSTSETKPKQDWDTKYTGRSTATGTLTRTVLGRVNTNTTGLNVASTSTLHKQTLHRSAAKAIPRPSPTPDVFAQDPVAPRTALGKRPRDPRDVTATASSSIPKRSRADVQRAAKKHREEQQLWREKWQRAFRNMSFHFDSGVDDGKAKRLRARMLKLGAKIDPFFTDKISCLIVKEITSPVKRPPRPKQDSENPFLDHTNELDLPSKAAAMGAKVWTLEKLAEMVNMLDPIPTTTKNDGGESLSALLAHEKLHGTRERDFSAPRPDYYYFKPGYKYLLVEDATGRNRPIMVKEYPVKDKGWPEVHEQFLKFSSSHELPPSVQDTSNLVKELRERAMTLYVKQLPFRGEEPPAPSLKRTHSLRDIAVTPLPEAVPYDKASGNSVVLTSNIASTSAANPTPGYNANGTPQLGANGNRKIMQMSKRVQVLKGNAHLAAVKKQQPAPGEENRIPESIARMPGLSRRNSTGMDRAPAAPPKEFLSQAQVVAMLKQLKGPTSQTRPSYQDALKNHERVKAGLNTNEQETASGYCENCRLRYTNLSIHIQSKKHRRFAQNPANFADLDDMLQCIQRPPNPLICVPTTVCRPCYKPHGKDEACGRCMDDPELYSSPAPSSQPGSARKEYTAWRMSEEVEEDVPDDGAECFEEANEPADWE